MKCRGTLFLLFLLLVWVQETSATRFALLIGNAHGGSEVVMLKYVGNDIHALETTLKDFCGFKKENIICISDKGPDEVERAFISLQARLSENEENLLFLYYSGHADREHLKMGDQRLPITTMKERFSTFPATVRIGIFDACQSGSFTRLKGGTLAEPFLFKDTGNIKGEVILSSSSATENAQESDLLGHSIFTFHFVNALRGSGDVSGDGKVTLAEAYQYSYHHTVSSTARTWGGVQHPSYQFRIQGEGDVVLADLTTSASGVLLEEDMTGTISLFDASDNIRADLTKALHSRIIIALNPGTYQLVVGGVDGRKWKSSVNVPVQGLLPVHMRQLEKIQPLPSQGKGTYNGFILGIAPLFRYQFLDLTSLRKSMDKAFEGFGTFGISPSSIDNGSGIAAGVTVRGTIGQRVTGSLSFSQYRHEKTTLYQGVQTAVDDDRKHGITLHCNESVSLTMLDIGLGYRMQWRPVRGVFTEGGICGMSVRHTITSKITAALYDLSGSNDFHEQGWLLVPYGGIGYSRMFTSFLDVSVFARYRYQRTSRHLLFNSSSASAVSGGVPGVPYNLKGVDLALTLLFCRRIGRIE